MDTDAPLEQRLFSDWEATRILKATAREQAKGTGLVNRLGQYFRRDLKQTTAANYQTLLAEAQKRGLDTEVVQNVAEGGRYKEGFLLGDHISTGITTTMAVAAAMKCVEIFDKFVYNTDTYHGLSTGRALFFIAASPLLHYVLFGRSTETRQKIVRYLPASSAGIVAGLALTSAVPLRSLLGA